MPSQRFFKRAHFITSHSILLLFLPVFLIFIPAAVFWLPRLRIVSHPEATLTNNTSLSANHTYIAPVLQAPHTTERTRNDASLPQPNHSRCALLTCSDRPLKLAQNFSHPFFYRIHRGLSHEVETLKLPPAWCRAPHLKALQRAGFQCVVYVDDDVFLNLDLFARAIFEASSLEGGRVIVASREGFGRKFNINAGLVAFTNLQMPYAKKVVNEWYRTMRVKRFRYKMKDQDALNEIVHCKDKYLMCYHMERRQQLGLLGHCFSVMNDWRVNGKELCMRQWKAKVRAWDAELLKQ